MSGKSVERLIRALELTSDRYKNPPGMAWFMSELMKVYWKLEQEAESSADFSKTVEALRDVDVYPKQTQDSVDQGLNDLWPLPQNDPTDTHAQVDECSFTYRHNGRCQPRLSIDGRREQVMRLIVVDKEKQIRSLQNEIADMVA